MFQLFVVDFRIVQFQALDSRQIAEMLQYVVRECCTLKNDSSITIKLNAPTQFLDDPPAGNNRHTSRIAWTGRRVGDAVQRPTRSAAD